MAKKTNLFQDFPCTKEGCSQRQVAKGLCRIHYQQHRRMLRSTKACPGCGKAILPESEMCHQCRRNSPKSRFCVDCGIRISHTAHREAKRCAPCHFAHRKVMATPKMCSVEGCQRPHKAKGFCLAHYIIDKRRKEYLGGASEWPQSFKVRRGDIAKQPCRLCGYNRLPSRLHRYIPGSQGGKYTADNVVPLCARCHAEIHAGITPCPSPL